LSRCHVLDRNKSFFVKKKNALILAKITWNWHLWIMNILIDNIFAFGIPICTDCALLLWGGLHSGYSRVWEKRRNCSRQLGWMFTWQMFMLPSWIGWSQHSVCLLCCNLFLFLFLVNFDLTFSNIEGATFGAGTTYLFHGGPGWLNELGSWIT
jgi:hypothetical protein